MLTTEIHLAGLENERGASVNISEFETLEDLQHSIGELFGVAKPESKAKSKKG